MYSSGAIQPFAEVRRAVESASHVLLLTDQRSDGDTFGSSLAFAHWLRGRGTRVTHYATSPILSMHAFLPGMDLVTRDVACLHDETIDAVVVFDSSREEAVRACIGELRAPLVVFDHHASNTRFGDVNVVETSASSTCEVVEAFFRACGIAIDDEMAKCLLTGVLTDTGMLSNATTTARSFEAARRLYAQGGSHKAVVAHIHRGMRVEQLRLWGRILARIVRLPSGTMAVTWVTAQDLEETGTSADDVSELSDFMSSVVNVEAMFFVKPRADGVKVSVRSQRIDLLPLARAFGGGGHARSCGFFLPYRDADTLPSAGAVLSSALESS